MCFSLHQLAYNATVNVQIIKTGFFPLQWFLEACVLFSFWLYAGYLKINFSTFTSVLSTYLLLMSIISLQLQILLLSLDYEVLAASHWSSSEVWDNDSNRMHFISAKVAAISNGVSDKFFFFIIIFSELSCAVSPHNQLEHQANNNIAFCIKYTCENWKNNKKNIWLICVRHRDYIYFQLTESQ